MKKNQLFIIFLFSLLFLNCETDSKVEDNKKQLENEIIGDWTLTMPVGYANRMHSIVYRFKADKTVLIGYLHTSSGFPNNYPIEDSYDTALKFYYKSNWTIDYTTLIVNGDLINFTADIQDTEFIEALNLQDDILYNVTNPQINFYHNFKKGSSITSAYQYNIVYDLNNIKTMDLSEYEFSRSSFTGFWRVSCCWGFQLHNAGEINRLIFNSSGEYHINPDQTYKHTFVFQEPEYFKQNLRRKINMKHRDAYGNPYTEEYYLEDFGVNSIGEVNQIILKGRDKGLSLYKY